MSRWIHSLTKQTQTSRLTNVQMDTPSNQTDSDYNTNPCIDVYTSNQTDSDYKTNQCRDGYTLQPNRLRLQH